MKTKEELNALKKEVETFNKKLAELTEEELAQVCGGVDHFATPNERVVDSTTMDATTIDTTLVDSADVAICASADYKELILGNVH